MRDPTESREARPPSLLRTPGVARRKAQVLEADSVDAASGPAHHRPILVLGVDRSGTSLLTQMISLWGAFAGPDSELGQGDENNPHGYFEHQPMQELLNMLHRETGVSMFDPAFPSLLRRLAREPRWRDEARKLVTHMEAPGRPWVWKEPELCLFLPFWKQVLDDPIYLITLRHPLHSARSYEKFMLFESWRGRIRLTANFLLRWQLFFVNILREIRESPDRLFIRYESLMKDPATESARIRRFLDDRCAGFARQRGADPVEAMSGVIDPALWRNRSGVDLEDVQEASEDQIRLYRYLLDRIGSGNVDDFDPAEYPLPPCAAEYLTNFDHLVSLIQQEHRGSSEA